MKCVSIFFTTDLLGTSLTKIETFFTSFFTFTMFQRVRSEKLVAGEKYKIKTLCYEFTGIYKEEAPYQHSRFIFTNVKGKQNYDSVAFSDYDNYYKFVSKNPQANMERRAVNKILQGILGDVHFEW